MLLSDYVKSVNVDRERLESHCRNLFGQKEYVELSDQQIEMLESDNSTVSLDIRFNKTLNRINEKIGPLTKEDFIKFLNYRFFSSYFFPKGLISVVGNKWNIQSSLYVVNEYARRDGDSYKEYSGLDEVSQKIGISKDTIKKNLDKMGPDCFIKAPNNDYERSFYRYKNIENWFKSNDTTDYVSPREIEKKYGFSKGYFIRIYKSKIVPDRVVKISQKGARRYLVDVKEFDKWFKGLKVYSED